MTRGISEHRFESIPLALMTDFVDALLSRLLVILYFEDEWRSCDPALLGNICATLTLRGLVDGGANVKRTGITT